MPIWFLPNFKNTINHQTTFWDDKIHIINVVWWYPYPTNKSYICFGSKIGRTRNTLRYSVRSWHLLQPANEVWCKVIFLHLFVILFTGGWGVVSQHAFQQGGSAPRGLPGPGGLLLGGCLVWGVWSGGSASGGCLVWGVCSRGCLVGGVPGLGEVCFFGGAWWRPPRTATAVGGTHPTGMLSCFPFPFTIVSLEGWRNLIFQELGLLKLRNLL